VSAHVHRMIRARERLLCLVWSSSLVASLALRSAPSCRTAVLRCARLRAIRGGAGSRAVSMSAKRDTRGTQGMAGTLFQFKSQQANLQAFESGPAGAARKLIVLGGLSDGMLACPYVPQLGEALAAEGWSLVQPNLRSSYMQWGFGSLDEDVEDLTALMDALVAERGATSLAVCGHSTGSQIIAHLMRTRPHASVSHVIMQGGVSDRESDDAEENRKRAESVNAARAIASSSPSGGQELMPRDTTWAPVTAQRFLDLNEVAGADDYFSSDLDEAQLAQRFRGFYPHTSVLIAYSAEDEYVPKSVDKRALLQRLTTAIEGGGAAASADRVVGAVLVRNGDHALYPAEAADEFIVATVAFLNGRTVPDMIA